jgi:ribosomal protein S18 acetylase RimI-like enzyme
VNETLQRIAECAVNAAGMGRTTLQVGPFRACLDPSTDLVYLNYVVPVWALGTKEETLAQLAQLRDFFHEHSRRLRFEFVDGIWPELRESLEAFGLELQHVMPLMACTPESFQPCPNPAVQTVLIGANEPEAHRLFYTIQREGFAMECEPAPEELFQIRSQIENGFWHCAIAELDGEPVAVGSLVPWGGASELAGVATLPSARRRGVAAALSSYLVAHHFATGGDLVWLTAATEDARAVYRKIGFGDAGLQWNYLEPGGVPA